MIHFFHTANGQWIAVQRAQALTPTEKETLTWLFSGGSFDDRNEIPGIFIGPRREMITPWSTTAVEITQNMNVPGIERIEEFFEVTDAQEFSFDKMLQRRYEGLDQTIFLVEKDPEPVEFIEDFEAYNQREGLALSEAEIDYLRNLSQKVGRPLTDSEVFGFSQVNSEHCRHKIFNGTFVIDGVEQPSSLFQLIKRTSKEHPGRIVSAYKDNCAFIQGPTLSLFHPASGDKPDFFVREESETVISLKAETHNFPTTVEPFNGAATGSGGEIRDRIAGGKGSFPIAGTAVYMTSYPRFSEKIDPNGLQIARDWENVEARNWLYQNPEEILIKASNGASDFGNKFGQPVICGSLQTLEHEEGIHHGFDKVIMLAGGVGYAKKKDSLKETPEAGDKVVLLGGDNYRIGMGGGAVSSVATGEFANAIELNAIQRSNPEMQKRAYNAIRAIAEQEENTIVSVHDHGAGGHLNCLSELVEELGGTIDIDQLPVGDKTLSAKELIGNESQERMGLVMKAKNVDQLRKIAERERAPFYVIGETTGEHNFTLKNFRTGETPIDLAISDLLGSTPKTTMTDTTQQKAYEDVPCPDSLSDKALQHTLEQVLQVEAVACKDWLTNKVDRSVTGLIANQQTCGEIQLPLNDLGVTAISYDNNHGIATSIGHAPSVAMIDPAAGSRIAIAEALTNVVWTPLVEGLNGVSLSANWMWPCKNPGENARLYAAVQGASDMAVELGINIPTGKDSMSMTQKYPNGKQVLSPGTLIVSTVAESEDIRKTVHTASVPTDSLLCYIPFVKEETFPLGGSVYAQVNNKIGKQAPDVKDNAYFAKAFEAIQTLVREEKILAGHDISAGGLITAALEMCFPTAEGGFRSTQPLASTAALFCEQPGVLIQVRREDNPTERLQNEFGIACEVIAEWIPERRLEWNISTRQTPFIVDIDAARDIWFRTSYLFDIRQVGKELATERFLNYKNQKLQYRFPAAFDGKTALVEPRGNNEEARFTAAIIREKGSNGDREMAWALHLAGFRVKDVHVTDLVSGRETLEDVNFIVFVGGFSNADTLGSAKGWAGALLYNEKARTAIDRFYARPDTLSLGVCNGCQLMAELGLITPEDRSRSPKMRHNRSHKYESAFVGVKIEQSPAVLLENLQGCQLGIWVAHGEGRFDFPLPISEYPVALRYNYNAYPANPNGSPEGIAGVCSNDGRHLAMMPHPERCLRPWNWPYYPIERKHDEVTPWMRMFENGRVWLEQNAK